MDFMKHSGKWFFILTGLLLLGAALAAPQKACAAQFQLAWVDVSSNEDGFKIERKSGKSKYRQIAITGPNVTDYLDSNLKAGAGYCYRVRAYNHAGNSSYSNPACGKTGYDLSVNKAGNGTGIVVGTVAGIDCGTTCLANYPSGTIVSLIPIPSIGSSFTDWSGSTDCKDGAVTMSSSKACTAIFTLNPVPPDPGTHGLPSSIGVFRPGTGEWFLDRNGSGVLDVCHTDTCVGPLGNEGDIPVAGSWMGTQATFLGVFDPGAATWYLDLNGNGVLDGCEANACRYIYGEPGDLPVVGDWTGEGRARIGVFRPGTGEWHFDINGDGDLAGCNLNSCSRFFGGSGDLPVVGDWTGEGKTKIGVFRPGTGEWLLDSSGDGEGKSCAGQCLSFGAEGDLPVVGDWNGAGADKIGVFRPGTGEWFLDLNGNGQWDGCNVDLCPGPFGQPGDLPVVGKWM
jgi:hypothetical protein